tara:strand:- start:589 stop:765 length:177 start_codon:yes stop_codon:yes gene_type:complete
VNKPKDKFPYKSITCDEYIKDRDKTFAENGNGWWWYQGTQVGRKIDKERIERKYKWVK